MTRKCPDCCAVSELRTDDASCFTEALLRSLRIIQVKRCTNCNAAVFVVLGMLATTQRRLRRLEERSFWLALVVILLATGYVVFEAIVS